MENYLTKLHKLVLTFLLCLIGTLAVPAVAKGYEEGGIQYRVSEQEAVITGAKVAGARLQIPASIGGFIVTEIASYAFDNSQYTEIILPDSVTYIGSGAFEKSRKLRKINIPGKVKRINEGTFSGCGKLTDIRLNNKLTYVGESAFRNCVSLKRIALPESLKTIAERAFEKCYKLSSVKLGKNVRKIGSRAFAKAYKLKKITIPKKTKYVCKGAFERCTGLTTVKFANPKTKLEGSVFCRCKSLKKAVLPKKIKNIPESTFAECSGITKVILPKTISIIQKQAFADCSSLKSVKLNSRVYAVGDKAFADSGLRSIKMNDNMQFIGNGAFQGTNIKSLTLKSKVTFIGNRVFANCSKLKRISVPASVKGINPGAFNNCVSLRAINVASGNANYCSVSGVLYNKSMTKLIQYPLHKTSASFRTPGRLERIRSNAFRGNSYLKNVTISASSIGRSAFSEMDNLRSVTILSGTRKIEKRAFQYNGKLAKITLPDSVNIIGSYAFAETGVRVIHIPSGLAKLGTDAFYSCKKLTAFTGNRGRKYSVVDGVLYNGAVSELLKYPAKRAGKVFTVPNTVKRVRGEAFENTSKLTKLYFGERFRTLEYHAVSNSKNLKSVVFRSKKLTYESMDGIYDCGKLAVIVGPNTYILKNLAHSANATLITL